MLINSNLFHKLLCEENLDPTSGTGGGGGGEGDKSGTSGSEGGSVAYETHRRLLGEKKTLQQKYAESEAKRAELEAEKEARTQKELEDQGKFQELLEAEKRKNEELLAENTGMKTAQVKAIKISSFLNTLDGVVQPDYYTHIPTDEIEYDPETRTVDEMSVTKAVEQFKKTHAMLIQKTGAITGMSSDAPPKEGGGTPITYAEWQKLPLKEMNERQKDVVD